LKMKIDKDGGGLWWWKLVMEFVRVVEGGEGGLLWW
jgi:hypothetical protein